jgi:hypothetical protein
MFYTDHVAYCFLPSRPEIEALKSKHRKIAILDLGEIPSYIREDEAIKLLDVTDKERLTIHTIQH